MKKILIALIILAIVAAGVWFFNRKTITAVPQQSNNREVIDTSDWLTYKNKEYGYEIKYPKGAILTGSGVDVTDFLAVEPSLKDEMRYGVAIQIIPIENSNKLSVRDYVYETEFNGEPFHPCSESEGTFLGIPAYYYQNEWAGRDGLYTRIYDKTYFFYHNNLFKLSFGKTPLNPSSKWKNHPGYNYLEKSIPITEAIIKSFKFTNPQTNQMEYYQTNKWEKSCEVHD